MEDPDLPEALCRGIDTIRQGLDSPVAGKPANSSCRAAAALVALSGGDFALAGRIIAWFTRGDTVSAAVRSAAQFAENIAHNERTKHIADVESAHRIIGRPHSL